MITETFHMIRAIKKMYPVITFFKDRYFPDGQTYYSDTAIVEMKKGNKRIAPFVIPVVNGIPMMDDAYVGYSVKAPYIFIKKPITPYDLEKKAFGESPDSNRSQDDRLSEIQAEHTDMLRNSIFRRFEKMSTDIITTGRVVMRHYATADDAAADRNYEEEILQFYKEEDGFQNVYKLPANFLSLPASKKIEVLYDMTSVLRKRHVRATDLIMTDDVSKSFMSDIEFLKFFDLARVDIGSIQPNELPEGVVYNGSINVRGVVLSLFTYDETFEDLDGKEKEFLPKGTMALLPPQIGETAYSQVTFVAGTGFKSYAEKIVPRTLVDENDNTIEIQMFSRPVPFPHDWESWLISNVYSSEVSDSDTGVSTASVAAYSESVDYKTEDEINAMTKKADVIAYAESIGLNGLSDSSTLTELKESVLNYQQALLDGQV